MHCVSKLKNGTLNAVILGDSISVSQGASNPLTTGWNADLNNAVFDKYSNKIFWDNKGASGKPPTAHLKDVLHPNDKGNQLMSDYIYNRINAVINSQGNW